MANAQPTSNRGRDVAIDKTFATDGGAREYKAGEVVHNTHDQTLIALARLGKSAHFVDKAPAPEEPAPVPAIPAAKPAG